MENPTVKDFITDLEAVLKAHPEDTLGQVLTNVRSSHEPVFLFDSDNFHGLLSPYTVLYKKRLPYDTKLKSALYHPPHITAETSIDELSSHMIASRLYTLPVYDSNTSLIGKVSLNDVLVGIKKDKNILDRISNEIELKTPLTLPENSTVRDAYNTLKHKNISRLLLTTNEGFLSGLISRRDLINAFMMPNPKERFSKMAERAESFSFDEEKVYRQDLPVKHFFNPGVHYVDERQSKRKMLEELIDSNFNSLVIVDGQAKPTGIFSYRDILKSLTNLSPETEVPILFNLPSTNVSEKEWEKAQDLLGRFLRKINKQIDVQKAELHVEEPKSPSKHTKIFNVHLKITPSRGKSLFTEAKEIKFLDAIHEVINEITRMERKEKTKQKRKNRKKTSR